MQWQSETDARSGLINSLEDAIRQGSITWSGAPGLVEQFKRRGSLSPKQYELCEKLIRESIERSMAKVRELAGAKPEPGPLAKLVELLGSVDIDSPKLRFQSPQTDLGYCLSLASPSSPNAGWAYLKIDGEYAGKISPAGELRLVGSWRDSRDGILGDLLDIAKDPEAAAVAYGRKTGSCSCCGRTLTNEESISLGIGPICRGRFFCA